MPKILFSHGCLPTSGHLALANQEKSMVTKIFVNSVGDAVAGGDDIYNSFLVCSGTATMIQSFAAATTPAVRISNCLQVIFLSFCICS
jgi:hypothetical protein